MITGAPSEEVYNLRHRTDALRQVGYDGEETMYVARWSSRCTSRGAPRAVMVVSDMSGQWGANASNHPWIFHERNHPAFGDPISGKLEGGVNEIQEFHSSRNLLQS